jgi:hypothetical protein
MTDSPARLPPADPTDITLTYQHRHQWWYDADTAPETWHVSAYIYDDSGTEVVEHVADMNIVALMSMRPATVRPSSGGRGACTVARPAGGQGDSGGHRPTPRLRPTTAIDTHAFSPLSPGVL